MLSTTKSAAFSTALIATLAVSGTALAQTPTSGCCAATGKAQSCWSPTAAATLCSRSTATTNTASRRAPMRGGSSTLGRLGSLSWGCTTTRRGSTRRRLGGFCRRIRLGMRVGETFMPMLGVIRLEGSIRQDLPRLKTTTSETFAGALGDQPVLASMLATRECKTALLIGAKQIRHPRHLQAVGVGVGLGRSPLPTSSRRRINPHHRHRQNHCLQAFQLVWNRLRHSTQTAIGECTTSTVKLLIHPQ